MTFQLPFQLSFHVTVEEQVRDQCMSVQNVGSMEDKREDCMPSIEQGLD